MLDLFREIVQALSNNKTRTALTGLSVAWGIFMLIVLLGMANGVTSNFRREVQSGGDEKITIFSGRTSEGWQGYKEGRFIQLEDDDRAILASQNGNIVKDVHPTIYGRAKRISTPMDYTSGSYVGCDPYYLESQGLTITSGRFVNNLDMEQMRKVIVLSESSAELLFGSIEQAVGGQVDVDGIAFKVIGVYKSRWGGRQNYVPYTIAAALSRPDGSVDRLEVSLKNVFTETDADDAETSLRSTLANAHTFSPTDQSAVYFWNNFKDRFTQNTAVAILEISVWLLGLFTMLSGIVGVSNIMFVSVKERTHEIGIRRAIGAKPRNILTQILTESIVITTLFGYVGIVLGIAVLELVASIFGGSGDGAQILGDASVDFSIIINVTLVLIVAGALSGLFPALKALKVKPVEALHAL
ncbi:MAG: ABC transporter permease [Muribaculaceae bacterium]|nr:ABC transporter permease [Muribaculaceae bacterium]